MRNEWPLKMVTPAIFLLLMAVVTPLVSAREVAKERPQDASPRVLVFLSIDKTTFRVGDTVEFTRTLKNETGKPVEAYPFRHMNDNVRFYWINTDTLITKRYGDGKCGWADPFTVNAGKVKKELLTDNVVTQASGTYFVFISCGRPGSSKRFISNAVRLRVIPKEVEKATSSIEPDNSDPPVESPPGGKDAPAVTIRPDPKRSAAYLMGEYAELYLVEDDRVVQLLAPLPSAGARSPVTFNPGKDKVEAWLFEGKGVPKYVLPRGAGRIPRVPPPEPTPDGTVRPAPKPLYSEQKASAGSFTLTNLPKPMSFQYGGVTEVRVQKLTFPSGTVADVGPLKLTFQPLPP
jgi:hypothetical protein